MGLHTGHGVLGGGDYIGIDVHGPLGLPPLRAGARYSSLTHGAMVQYDLPDGVALQDLGQHRLKDIAYPEHLFDLVIDGLPGSFPAIRSLDVQPNNLPLQLTSFVGRADEIAQTVELLGSHRLVTLTGPGGSGKTRLALQVAAEVLARFEDGVFFVDLVPVSDHTQVPSVLAQVLGMREQPGRGLIETLVDGLAAKDVLLLLDNFEHVLPAAWVAERLLGAAPRLRILVTSRAPLRIYGEQEQQVLPLALPDPDSNALEFLSRCEAVALFSERARAAQARFALTEENAASWRRMRPPRRLATGDRAGRQPDQGADSAGNPVPARRWPGRDSGRSSQPASRQRTLRATISWSCGQLTEPEQRLFARLSVFRGGASIEALHAVGNPGGDLGVDTLEVLTSLIDNSLVRQTELPDGEPRFGMLETIREYAAELLAAQQDSAPTERRHAEHFLALAHEAGRISPPSTNVAGSTASSVSTTTSRQPSDGRSRPVNPSAGCRQPPPCGGSGSNGASYPSDGVGWNGCCRPASTRRAVVAKAHLAAGGIAYWQRDYGAADQHYQEALAISQALDDRHGIADATYNLAFVFAEELAAGKPDWASGQNSLRLLRDALAQFELDDPAGVAKGKGNIAFFLAGQGDLDSAKPLLEEAIASYRQLGDMFHLADALVGYGQGCQMLGQLEEARAPILEGLGLLDQADNLTGLSGALETLSILESAHGRHERAMRLLGAAQEIRRTIEGGYPMSASSIIGTDPVGDARKTIGDVAVDRALAEGRSMTRAEAVDYATELET